MDHQRRKFLKVSGLAVSGLGVMESFAAGQLGKQKVGPVFQDLARFQITKNMKEAYQVALNVLKPSKSQLEHGLELHKDAVVVDCYGFMPRAAVDGERMKKAVEENASPLELQDMQEDMSMTRFVEIQRETEEFINAWKASGVTCVIQNSGEEGSAIERLLKRLSRFTYATDWMKDILMKAVTPEDILLAKEQNKHSLYLRGMGYPCLRIGFRWKRSFAISGCFIN